VSRLEERYRSVLRLLPVSYREAWEDEMVAAFLESMQTGDPDGDEYAADYGRPSLSEVASVISLAVRLRVAGTDAPARSVAWGQAIRLATLTATLVNAVMATAGIATTLWLSGKIGWLPAPPAEFALAAPSGVWHGAWNLAGYAWLPAYVALVLGHRRAAQAVALLAIAPSALTIAVDQATGHAPLAASPWAARLTDLLVVLGMAAFHHDTRPPGGRRWLLALPIGILLVPLPLFALQLASPEARLLDWPGLACALVTAAMAGFLAARASGRLTRALPWSLALTLLGAAALGLRLVTLPENIGQPRGATLVAIALVEAVATVAVGAPVAALAVRALRRLAPILDDRSAPSAPSQ
jgi:hypothetical protein